MPLDIQDLLEEVGLSPYVMTTGSRGMHVVAPLDRSAGFDDVRAFARDLADLLARRHRPDDDGYGGAREAPGALSAGGRNTGRASRDR